MRAASDVEKRREIGQIEIFSPLLYQLGCLRRRLDFTPSLVVADMAWGTGLSAQ